MWVVTRETLLFDDKICSGVNTIALHLSQNTKNTCGKLFLNSADNWVKLKTISDTSGPHTSLDEQHQ